MRTSIARGLFLVVWLIGLASPSSTTEAGVKPNIILILADDLGWADLGCYGSTFHKTPQIDRLASQGVRFTDAYAAGPVCSPTRASLLTGRHPARLHITDWLPGRQDRPSQKLLKPEIERHLPLEEVTLAEALKPAGYVCASIGKWHLGGRGFLPQDQGFDLNIAGDESGTAMSYFAPFRSGARVMPGLEQSHEGEYLTDRLTDEAEKFVEENRDRPFFLYLAHYAVHIPLKAKEELVRRYQASPATDLQTNVLYAAMLESVDQSVGRIMQKLEALNLAERTILIFASDNGGLSSKEGPDTPSTSNAPLREGKGHLYEGGIRIPWIIRWPGKLPAGKLEATPVSTVDFFPTALAMAEVEAGTRPLDGVNLLPVLRESAPLGREALYWHYPHYSNQGGTPSGAVREGDLKLLQFLEDGRLELYNLKDDLGETHNLVANLPATAADLRTKLKAWRQAMGAQMMEPNPDYVPVATPGAKILPQMGDGTVWLHARDAIVHGSGLRYEPQPFKNTLGYWTNAEDWASWDFEVNDPGTFSVEVLQGCGSGSGGSQILLSIGAQSLDMTVQDTGGFQNFVTRQVGTFRLEEAGRYALQVKAKSKPGLAVMDLRSISLKLQNAR